MPNFQIPTANSNYPIEITPGKSIVIIGANGAGKTRLGVLLEVNLAQQNEVHRVAAHKSLVMNTDVQPSSFEKAERLLFYGYQEENGKQYRFGQRWQNKPATALLSDFDHVLRALYADENRVSTLHRQAHRQNPAAIAPETKLDRLKTVWEALLPERRLVILDSSIKVAPNPNMADQYDASDLSDGERVMFYLLGQCLLVRPGCILIIDEPELHIHKAILSAFWDAIETARNDCAFIYLTHDLEFASSRRSAQKIALQRYHKKPQERWELEVIPEDAEIPEDVIAKVLGSRTPILFVEGDSASLDVALYRRVYSNFTVIPVGSCDAVIHSVSSFTKHATMHRFGCAGIIDSDDRNATEIASLEGSGVYTLAVSEVENLLLLPTIFELIAQALNFSAADARTKASELSVEILQIAQADLDHFALEYTRRRIDRTLKVVGLKSKDIASLDAEFKKEVGAIDPSRIFSDARKRVQDLISAKDGRGVLASYSNKGLIASAAKYVGLKGRKELEEFVGRTLRSDAGIALLAALVRVLPNVAPH